MIADARWGRIAVSFGLAVVGSYLLIALRLLPMPLLRALFVSMGPLLAVAVYALGQWLAVERDSAALRIGVLLHIVASAFVSAMAIVQNVNYAFMRRWLDATSEAPERDVIQAVFRGIDGVQLGLDLAWDLWLTIGAVFLAGALINHPRFGKVMGWTGIAAAGLVLALNLWTFPVPPGQAGLIDAGPVLAAWYLAVVLLAARRPSRPRAAFSSDAPAEAPTA